MNARIELGCHVHGARKRLEASFNDVMRILPSNSVDVQIHTERICEGGKELVRQIRIEIPHSAGANLDVVRKIGPATDVDANKSEFFLLKS